MENLSEFLENFQYTRKGILKYEQIYGDGSVSTGGIEMAADMIEKLKLKSGEQVLDVGCGIGGQAFYMAGTYRVEVVGVDFSQNMLSLANERLHQHSEDVKKLVTFRNVDVNEEEIGVDLYDALHCRDTMMHVSSKKVWIEKFHRCLKHGGRICVSDYFRGKGQNSQQFDDYVTSRKYTLITLQSFKEIFEEIGFRNVDVFDGTISYGNVLANEIERLEANRDKFVQQFSAEDYEEKLQSWKSKLRLNKQGDHQWGYVYAEK